LKEALTTVKAYKLIILIICFALTSFLIYRTPTSTGVKKQVSLQQALKNIEGWYTEGHSPLDTKIVKALELDDYINQNYSNGNDMISLYIGYYFTTKKVGAAHDPLVCFPGQGWVVSDTQKNKIVLNPKPADWLAYSSMIAHRGLQKELIIFWFQSYDKTNPDTFSQKITSLYQKIFHHREDNAFVRISIPVGEKSLSKCHEAIFTFIQSFYPVFLNYVKQG
jgi:EpsI family protein